MLAFMEELAYWQIDERTMEHCCHHVGVVCVCVCLCVCVFVCVCVCVCVQVIDCVLVLCTDNQ